jgi:hypothetical protein
MAKRDVACMRARLSCIVDRQPTASRRDLHDPVIGALTSPAADAAPPAEKRDLADSVVFIERGKPLILPDGKALRKASR